MQIDGKIHGEYARKFAGFCYRLPLKSPLITSIRDLDPHRVYPDREYPRYTSMAQPRLDTVDLADYSVRFSQPGDDGMTKVGLWLTPNQFTQEKVERKVYEFKVINAFVHRHRYHDEILSEAMKRF